MATLALGHRHRSTGCESEPDPGTSSRTARVVLAVVVLAVVFGALVALLRSLESWGDARPHYGDEGFVFGSSVPSAEIAYQVLLEYNMASDDAACAIEFIFTPDFEFDPWYGDLYTITADMLDDAIEACDIDTDRITMPYAD